jgi:signal transduction histidine kinase
VAEALNASADRINDLIRRERQLTADTSHQLRTPLAGLRLTLEGEHASPGGNPQHIIEEALGAVHRLEQTVEDLTTLARGATPASRVDLRHLADEAAARWAHQFRRAGRPVAVSGSPTWVPRARRSGLDTIVDVLLDNALRHGTGAVRIAVDHHDGTVRLTVSDEGRCDQSDQELFTRATSAGGSSGIGLDLARSVAVGEGGTLELSRPAPTTFTLALPAGAGAARL